MRRVALVAVLVLAAGIEGTAEAHQTEVDVQGINLEDERIAKARRERIRERRQRERETSEPEPVTYSTSSSGAALSEAEVAAYARGAGFPESIISTMVAIAWRESSFIPSAINPSSGACGLWQMYPCPGPEALDPATNAAMAYAKYEERGLEPWGY
jgi:hypothetical protein